MIFSSLYFLLLFHQFPPANTIAVDHDFHVSTCQLEYNPYDQALQISIHLFIDDLEDALRLQGIDGLYLCTKRESEKAELAVFAYLQQNFRLHINGQAIELQWVGKETSEDLLGVWCYLEGLEVPPIKEISVSAPLLMELYEDQKNILQIELPGQKKGYHTFTKGRSKKTFNF